MSPVGWMPENTRAMRGDGRASPRQALHAFGDAPDHAPERHRAVDNIVPMPYSVQTPVFEGPLDLLLHLILSEQVDLYEIRLSTIVDSYLAELDRMEQLDLDMASEFLLIAATLVELKSRRLLPHGDELDLDDELALWEERDLLLHRLVECKTFKEAAIALSVLAREAGRSVGRTVGVDERYVGLMPDLLAGVTPADVRLAYLRAIAPKPRPSIDLDHVAPIRASVTDAIAELVDELPRFGRITFRALTDGLVERLEVVVRFLAILELFKLGLVDLDQAVTFGDIQVVWVGGERGARDLAGIDAYDG
jgi:segregation and condensation protein A